MTAATKSNNLPLSGQSKILKEAGFVKVSRAALLLCRMRLLDFAKVQKRILTQRPLSLLSLVGKPSQTEVIELTVNTTSPSTERRAAKVVVRYFTIFGREIDGLPERRRFNLFADPVGTAAPQRLYTEVPVRAFWRLVSIHRQTESQRIGMRGSLRPRPLMLDEPLAFAAALESRDRRSLEFHLLQAQGNQGRENAMQLLSWMIFLERRPDDIRSLRFIADIDQVISDLAAKAIVRQGTADQGFVYSNLLTTPFDNSVPLSKWLASEGISLNAEIKKQSNDVSELVITPGEHWGQRIMAAINSGYSVFLEEVQDDSEQIPWIKHQEILSFLSLP